MLGYISSSRKKSCERCAKSKRRCDLGYPVCKRCYSKDLNCTYPNATSVHEAEVVVRQSTPDLLPVGTDLFVAASSGSESPPPPDPAPLALSSDFRSNIFQTSPETAVQWGCDDSHEHQRLAKPLVPEVWAPVVLNDAQVGFMVNQACGFVRSMAYSGFTVYLHENLYASAQPSAYQDSVSLCALYHMKTRKNLPIIANTIHAKVSGLIAAAKDWTLAEHLAAVQALMVYQVIRLFDADLRLQAVADQQNHLLEAWTTRLWKRSFLESTWFPSCYDSWVFFESLRRTVLMSVMLRGVWHCVTQGGICQVVPILSRLPIAKDARLWELGPEDWTRERGGQELIAYSDFSLNFEIGSPIEELTEYQRLLLAACRGGDDPRLCVT